jgi:hypothetical protein
MLDILGVGCTPNMLYTSEKRFLAAVHAAPYTVLAPFLQSISNKTVNIRNTYCPGRREKPPEENENKANESK